MGNAIYDGKAVLLRYIEREQDPTSQDCMEELHSRRSPASSLGWRADATIGMLCAVAVPLIASVGLLNTPRFFFTDDYQTQFMPLFQEISRLIGQGEMPFITDRVWHGGAILAEYQAAVLNPVSVLLYLLISRLDEAAWAAAVYSLAHLSVYSGGTYFLCRSLNCQPRFAVLAAVIAPTSD